MPLLPGLLLVALVGWSVWAEITLRRRWPRGQERPRRLRLPVAIVPTLIFVGGAGSLAVLTPAGFLTILLLPSWVGMTWLALDWDRRLLHGVGVATALSVLGAVAIGVSR